MCLERGVIVFSTDSDKLNTTYLQVVIMSIALYKFVKQGYNECRKVSLAIRVISFQVIISTELAKLMLNKDQRMLTNYKRHKPCHDL